MWASLVYAVGSVQEKVSSGQHGSGQLGEEVVRVLAAA